ncbi:HAMP domain-containing histidine kinase [bacterium]|nr:HAMP domain-containing histidine kinase [bacterium]
MQSFTPFSRLGLAICHSIIKKHDGHIFVSSELNKGTTFTILLPATQLSEQSYNLTLPTSASYGTGDWTFYDAIKDGGSATA